VSDDKSRSDRQEGVAHIPATVLTVEYVDDSKSMDAALKELNERLSKMEERVSALQERQGALVTAVNQQAKDIGRFLQSLSRRVDRVYRTMVDAEGANAGGATATEETPAAPAPEAATEGEQPAESAPEPQEETPPPAEKPEGEDEEHKKAWRTARVLAADLEAYHEDAVKEGVLYGTFFKLLHEPIEKARKTYEQRVPDDIVENYDYFSKALDELIARKRMDLESGQ
jgi:TolA-binding protein